MFVVHPSHRWGGGSARTGGDALADRRQAGGGGGGGRTQPPDTRPVPTREPGHAQLAPPATTKWWRRLLRWICEQIRRAVERMRELLVCAPFGNKVSAALVVAALVPFVAGGFEGLVFHLPKWWPNTAATAAAAFPGPAAAILGLGLMIGPLTLLTYAVDGWPARISFGQLRIGFKRPPVLTALGLLGRDMRPDAAARLGAANYRGRFGRSD